MDGETIRIICEAIVAIIVAILGHLRGQHVGGHNAKRELGERKKLL